MNSNADVRKMVRNTVVSFIIIALGLLIVCGVRPPQPAFEDFDETENISGDGAGLSENDDLSSLLNDGDKEALTGDMELAANNDAGDGFSESNADLFGDQSSDDMNEILSLLESDADDAEFSDDSFLSDDFELADDSPVEYASVSEVTGKSGGSEEANQFEGSLSNEEFNQLNSEADRLAKVLDSKNSEAESLKTVLEKYDEKIAVMELEKSGAGSSYQPSSTNMNYAASTSERSSASHSRISQPASTPKTRSSSPAKKSAASPKVSPFESKYQTAVRNFTSEKFRQAIEQFEYLIYSDANNALADNCQYFLGECFLAQNKYTQAVIEFEKVFIFDNNDKAPDAQMKLGLTFMKAGNTNQAKMEFDNVLAFYSDSEFARKARNYLRQL
ncbi:hypothetical protein JXJ21_11510 [candidate division KSB1 bacterium]|nr:hypothetical protein [candidate division KSB1 bacterium]